MLHGLGDCTAERHCGCLAGAPTDHTAAIAEKAREYRDIVGRLADDASPAAYDAADDAQDRLFAAVDAERAEREADRG